MSILDNEGHDPMGLGNAPSRSEITELRSSLGRSAAEISRLQALAERAADELERISFPEDEVDGLVAELRGHQQRTQEPE